MRRKPAHDGKVRVRLAPDAMGQLPLFDDINKASHYNQGGIECIEAAEAMLSHEEFVGAMKFQVLKYNWRGNHKDNAVRDAKKAQYYQERLTKALENTTTTGAQ